MNDLLAIAFCRVSYQCLPNHWWQARELQHLRRLLQRTRAGRKVSSEVLYQHYLDLEIMMEGIDLMLLQSMIQTAPGTLALADYEKAHGMKKGALAPFLDQLTLAAADIFKELKRPY